MAVISLFCLQVVWGFFSFLVYSNYFCGVKGETLYDMHMDVIFFFLLLRSMYCSECFQNSLMHLLRRGIAVILEMEKVICKMKQDDTEY